MWARGPEPAGLKGYSTMFLGGNNDEKPENLDKFALYHVLPKGKKAIRDLGYEGMPEKVTITQHTHSKVSRNVLVGQKNGKSRCTPGSSHSTIYTAAFTMGSKQTTRWIYMKYVLRLSV